MRVLLVDQSRDRATLVAVRDLAAAGFTVGTGSAGPSFASTSRYTARHHEIQECEEDEDRFVADVASAVASGGYDIVFCTYDVGLIALSRRREEIAPAVWPYAQGTVVERAFDKLELASAARRAGLSAPRTERADTATLAAWNGPVVVKARTHVPSRFSTARFSSASQAQSLIEQIRTGGGEPLLQEPMAGRMGAVVMVVDASGEPVVEIHQEALRTWPPDAGDTVHGVISATDPELSRGARALVRELDWFGLVQIEFIRDTEGTPQITDFNGRFYGSMALASGAGLNLAGLWASHAVGLDGVAAHHLRRRRGFQWLNRDLAAARAEGPRALLGAVAAIPLTSHSMWNLRDPGPAIRYLLPESARRVRARLAGTRKAAG